MYTIEINGDKYEKVTNKNKKRYVIVRTYSAGVFAGYLEKEEGREVELSDARRAWYWSGASSLSEMCMKGVSKPDECKFPCEVNKVILKEVIEILDCTEEARLNIKAVPVWTSH